MNYDTLTTVEDGVLTVTVMQEVVQMDLAGEETEYMEEVAEIELPENPELAREIGEALEGWYGKQMEAEAGPPDDVPPHEA